MNEIYLILKKLLSISKQQRIQPLLHPLRDGHDALHPLQENVAHTHPHGVLRVHFGL